MDNNPLIIALDCDNSATAEEVVKRLSPAVRTFKIGKELFTAAGPEIVRNIHAGGARVFLDLKFHDIPNTVAGAVRAAAKLGVFMLNVHATGGAAMMKKAADAAGTGPGVPIILGVTVLTSMDEAALKEIGLSGPVDEAVLRLARLAKASGLGGVVASGKEAVAIRRSCGKDFVIVTPGVRPAWAAANDQKRVMTPKEAIAAGADYIVVGRPVTEAKDPLLAAKKILEEIG